MGYSTLAQEVQLLQEVQHFGTGGAAATGGTAFWHRRCSCYRRYSTLAQEGQLLQEVQHFGTGVAAATGGAALWHRSSKNLQVQKTCKFEKLASSKNWQVRKTCKFEKL